MPTQDWRQISRPNHYPDAFTICQLLYSQTSNSGLLFAFIFKQHSGFICYHRNQSKFGCKSLVLFKYNSDRYWITVLCACSTLEKPHLKCENGFCSNPKNDHVDIFAFTTKGHPKQNKAHDRSVLPRDELNFHGFPVPRLHNQSKIKLENVFKTGDRIYINKNYLVSMIKFVQSTHYWSPNVHSLTCKTKEKWHKFSLKCMQM